MCEAGGFAIETLPSLAGLRSADGGDLRASCMRDFLRGESASTTLVDELRPLFAAVAAQRWQDAVAVLESIPREQRSSPRVQLLEARCNAMLGRWGHAQRAAGRRLAAYSPR